MGTHLPSAPQNGAGARAAARSGAAAQAGRTDVHTLRTPVGAAKDPVRTVVAVNIETSAPTIGVVELPGTAEALKSLGFNVVTGSNMREALVAIRAAYASGRFPLVSADIVKGGLKMWLATAIKTNPIEVVLVHEDAPKMNLENVESLHAEASLIELFSHLGLEAPEDAVDYTCAGRLVAPAEEEEQLPQLPELPDFDDFDEEDEAEEDQSQDVDPAVGADEDEDDFYDEDETDQEQPQAEQPDVEDEPAEDQSAEEDDDFYDEDETDEDEQASVAAVAPAFDPEEWAEDEEEGALITAEPVELPSDEEPILAADMMSAPEQTYPQSWSTPVQAPETPAAPARSWLAAPEKSLGDSRGLFSDFHGTQQFRRGRGYSGEGTVIFSLAGKGGVGKSTTAQQIAAEAARAELSVILVDGNSGQGDQRQYLGLKELQGLPSVIDAHVSGQPQSAVITREQLSGLRDGATDLSFDLVLAPPPELEEEGTVPPEVYANLITWCKSHYDITVVDTQILEANDQTGFYSRMVLPMLHGDDGWAIGVTDMNAAGMQNLLERFDRMIKDGVPVGRLFSLFNAVESDYMELATSQEIRDWMEVASRFMGMIPAIEGLKFTMNRGNLYEPTPTMTQAYAGILFVVTNNPFFEQRLAEATDAVLREEAGLGELETGRPARRRGFLSRLGRGN